MEKYMEAFGVPTLGSHVGVPLPDPLQDPKHTTPPQYEPITKPITTLGKVGDY